MFPVLFAELRPLFFRYRLRGDKDESVELDSTFLHHISVSLFVGNALFISGYEYTTCDRRFKSGASLVFTSGWRYLTGDSARSTENKQPANR